MKTPCSFVRISVLLLLFSGVASASTAGKSTAEAKKQWYQDLRLNLFGWSYGPSFGQFGEGRGATSTGALGSPVTIGTQLNINAPAFGGFLYTAIEALTWSPFNATSQTTLLTPSNPAFGIAGTHIDRTDFSWWARYEIEPAVLSASVQRGEVLTARSVTVLTANLGPKRYWSLRAIVVPAWQVLNSGTTNSVYLMPSVSYIVHDRLSWMLFLEAAYSRAAGDSFLSWSKAMDPNLAFGPVYSFKSGYWMQPFVSTYPGGRINADTTFAGIYFGGRVL